METGMTIQGQTLRRVGVDLALPADVMRMIHCGETTIYKVIEVFCGAVNSVVKSSDTNAEALEKFTAELSSWAQTLETEIRAIVAGGDGSESKIIGFENLTTALQNMLKNGLLTAEQKSKIEGLENYELPAATASLLGGVKIASGIDVDASGRISTSLAKLGLTFNPTTKKMTLRYGASNYDVQMTLNEESSQSEIAVYVTSFTPSYNADGTESSKPEQAIMYTAKSLQPSVKSTFECNQPYFRIAIPDDVELETLTMNGAFGSIDILSDVDQMDDKSMQGVTCHVYEYKMANVSATNPVTYEFSVTR